MSYFDPTYFDGGYFSVGSALPSGFGPLGPASAYFDGCYFDPAYFDASVCAPATTSGGHPGRKMTRRQPDILPTEDWLTEEDDVELLVGVL